MTKGLNLSTAKDSVVWQLCNLCSILTVWFIHCARIKIGRPGVWILAPPKILSFGSFATFVQFEQYGSFIVPDQKLRDPGFESSNLSTTKDYVVRQLRNLCSIWARGTVESSRVGHLPKAFRNNSQEEKAGKELEEMFQKDATCQDKAETIRKCRLRSSSNRILHMTVWLTDRNTAANFLFQSPNTASSSFPNFLSCQCQRRFLEPSYCNRKVLWIGRSGCYKTLRSELLILFVTFLFHSLLKCRLETITVGSVSSGNVDQDNVWKLPGNLARNKCSFFRQ